MVTINGINIFETYQSPLANRHCVQPPVPKMFFQDIPGADGALDLSTVISGRPIYERREITMTFNCTYPTTRWPTTFSMILKDFHGKEGKIIFDDDESYYYLGRMAVSDYERFRETGTFTITVNADPYKYEILSSLDDWLWGPFNLEIGVIREYRDLVVRGSLEIQIPGTEKWIIPEITVSENMTVRFENRTYNLLRGVNKNYGIVLKEGDNVLNFIGNGTVTIVYRGGML